jgi:hypothetical protein
MIFIASKGHLLTHKPQPMQSVSEIKQMVEVGITSMQIFPVVLTGQAFLHSYLHFLGLHLSGFIIAILSLSSPLSIFDNEYFIKINIKHERAVIF